MLFILVFEFESKMCKSSFKHQQLTSHQFGMQDGSKSNRPTTITTTDKVHFVCAVCSQWRIICMKCAFVDGRIFVYDVFVFRSAKQFLPFSRWLSSANIFTGFSLFLFENGSFLFLLDFLSAFYLKM